MKSDVWITSQRIDRSPLIGDADAGVMVAEETALMHLRSERQGLAEPGQLADNGRRVQPCDRANAKLSTCSIRAAHAEFIAALKARPPRAIPLDLNATDLEERARHLDKVFKALSVYVAVILDDTGQNIPGRVDFGDIGAALADLASDVTGTIQLAADAMAGRVA